MTKFKTAYHAPQIIFEKMSKERAFQAVANALQTHRHVSEAFRLKTVSDAPRVQCPAQGLPANASLPKRAMQINCLSQPMQKRKIVYHI
mmetsp:Transcript_17004/g.26599  ORF Transcript_17004/g.26599 Transcript_17004/m.26599 type:complete len:89 (-) Transcript_17004:961-1227(-)